MEMRKCNHFLNKLHSTKPTSYIYGLTEAGFERLGTVSIIKNIEKIIARASMGTRRLIQDSTKQVRILENNLLLTVTEALIPTAEGQLAADRYIAKKRHFCSNENRSEGYIAKAFLYGRWE
jgi:hypothetical protein